VGELQDALATVARKIRRYRDGGGINEQDTKAALIEPVFRALGWDLTDPDEVKREHRHGSQANPVDYAFVLNGETHPVLLLEAKALGSPLERHTHQLLGYAAVAGVEWVVLTDGHEYRLYNAHAKGDAAEKLFRSFCVPSARGEDATVLSLLSRDALSRRELQTLWGRERTDRLVHEALTRLLDGTDPGLASLLARRLPGLTRREVADSLSRARAGLAATAEVVEPVRPGPVAPADASDGQPLREHVYRAAVVEFLAAAPGREAALDDIREAVRRRLPLGSLDMVVDAGGCARWVKRVASALSRLKTEGAAERSGPSRWRLLSVPGAVSPPPKREPYAKTAYTLNDLVEAGLLRLPATLSAVYKKTPVEAVAYADGRIEAMGEQHRSVSGAAGRVRGLVSGDRASYATDGWTFWRVEAADGSTRTLASLRDELTRARAASADAARSGEDEA